MTDGCHQAIVFFTAIGQDDGTGTKVIDEEIETFAPVHLVDDTVIIQPVEWTKQ